MNPDNPDDRTILSGSDPEFIADLSEYLDVLASPVRLHILSFTGIRPRTVRQIAHEIETSYENTKKHLIRLLSIGLIQKEIGVSDEPANQGQPVFYYSLTPDGLNHAVHNLTLFTSVTGTGIKEISEQIASAKQGLLDILPGTGPFLSLTNGHERHHRYELTAETYRIGRIEEGWDGALPEPAILVGDSYRSVSRASRPHAWLRKKSGVWTIEEGNSKGGTFLNGTRVTREPILLKGGDLIELSPGSLGAAFLFMSGRT